MQFKYLWLIYLSKISQENKNKSKLILMDITTKKETFNKQQKKIVGNMTNKVIRKWVFK